MAEDRNTAGAPPNHIHIEKGKSVNWLAWIALLLGVLALIWALIRHNGVATTTTTDSAVTTAATTGAATGTAVAATTTASVGELGAYLAGSEAVPRTFAFDTMHFATASSVLTPADRTTVEDVATVLAKSPTTSVKVVGYADSRGTSEDNRKLGLDRAEAVKAALVGKGVDASRVATGSGGDTDPVDTNATAGGQAENRRTELVVVTR